MRYIWRLLLSIRLRNTTTSIAYGLLAQQRQRKHSDYDLAMFGISLLPSTSPPPPPFLIAPLSNGVVSCIYTGCDRPHVPLVRSARKYKYRNPHGVFFRHTGRFRSPRALFLHDTCPKLLHLVAPAHVGGHQFCSLREHAQHTNRPFPFALGGHARSVFCTGRHYNAERGRRSSVRTLRARTTARQ